MNRTGAGYESVNREWSDDSPGISVNHSVGRGIGGDRAADLCRALRRKVDRIQQPDFSRRVAGRFNRGTGFATQPASRRIDLEHARHLLERQHQLTTGRRRGTGQARASTRGNDRDRVRCTDADDRLHLLHRAWKRDRNRIDRPASPTTIRSVVLEVLAVEHEAVRTELTLNPIGATDITRYLATGAATDKAGGLEVQDRARSFVAEVGGCWANVVGLPLCAVSRQLGVAYPRGACAEPR